MYEINLFNCKINKIILYVFKASENNQELSTTELNSDKAKKLSRSKPITKIIFDLQHRKLYTQL